MLLLAELLQLVELLQQLGALWGLLMVREGQEALILVLLLPLLLPLPLPILLLLLMQGRMTQTSGLKARGGQLYRRVAWGCPWAGAGRVGGRLEPRARVRVRV